MLEKLSFIDVLAGVINKISANTDLRAVDTFKTDEPLPFAHVEIAGQIPGASKTQWLEKYQIYVHVWAEGKDSSVPIYDAIKKVQESLTERIEVPDGYQVLLQDALGVNQILQEEDSTRHAILGYEITINYGFKTKF